MFTGPTATIPETFGELGFEIPGHYNPADWLLDVAQGNEMETLEKVGFFPPPMSLAPPAEGKLEESIDADDSSSLWTEFRMLMNREMKSVVRNPVANIINLAFAFFLALLAGIIFLHVGKEERTNLLVRFSVTITLDAGLVGIVARSARERRSKCCVCCSHRSNVLMILLRRSCKLSWAQ